MAASWQSSVVLKEISSQWSRWEAGNLKTNMHPIDSLGLLSFALLIGNLYITFAISANRFTSRLETKSPMSLILHRNISCKCWSPRKSNALEILGWWSPTMVPKSHECDERSKGSLIWELNCKLLGNKFFYLSHSCDMGLYLSGSYCSFLDRKLHRSVADVYLAAFGVFPIQTKLMRRLHHWRKINQEEFCLP